MARRANLDLELNGYRDARGYDADESNSGSGEDGGYCEEGWGDGESEEEARAQGGEVGSVGDSVEVEGDDAMAVDKVEFEVEESMDVDIDQEGPNLEVGTNSEMAHNPDVATKSDVEKSPELVQQSEIVYKKPEVVESPDTIEPFPLSRLTPSMRLAYEWVDPSDESAVETPEESDEEDGAASPDRGADTADDADGEDGEDESSESDGASSFYGAETEDTEASSSDVDSVEMERARLEEDAERERQEDEALPESEESAVETASESDDSDASNRLNADEDKLSGSGSDTSTLYGPESEDTVEDNADRVSLVETEPISEPEEDGGATSSGSFDFCEWWATYLDIRALFNEPRW